MIKLKKILNEILNSYSVAAFIKSDRKFAITDILNQIRAVRKITTVRNITPEDYPQKENTETTKIIIKFITRGDTSVDLENFKKEIMTSDLKTTDAPDLRIPGVRLIDFKPETLKRL